jgi:uncharacterized protein
MNGAQGITLKDALAAQVEAKAKAVAAPQLDATQRVALAAQVDRVCNRIAPLWPLKHFVAVNPFLGMSHLRFEQAAATLERVAGARMTMPRAFYCEQVAAGRIRRDDLRQALPADGRLTLAQLEAALQQDRMPAKQAATVAEVLDALALPDAPQGGFAAFVTDKLSQLCAGYFDQGQAQWPLPWKDESLYLAWRAAACIDLTPEAAGVRQFRAGVAALPDDPLQAIAWALRTLHISEQAADDYLHCALASIGGWAGWTRYRQWQQALRHGDDRSVVDLLAIRVVWDALLYRTYRTQPETALDRQWRQVLERMTQAPDANQDLAIDLALQRAFEAGYQRQLAATLAEPARAASSVRAAVQAVFCIDVRSEVLRRALERVTDQVQTLGFAGFFGLAIDYLPLGAESGRAQCPVLLAPGFTVQEGVPGADAARLQALAARRKLAARMAALWKGFRASAVSCFSFVEAFGPLFAVRLLRDGLGRSGTLAGTRHGNDGVVCTHGHNHGVPVPQRIDAAEKILRGMSLTRDFARLVLLAGHGSSSVNNPHASGLDCGACGGHTGEANARLAAQLLNDAEVRTGLAARGIVLPADTVFVAALHDTTLDEVTLFDTGALPASHAADIAQLREWLQQAGALARQERAAAFGHGGVAAAHVDAAILRRSRDWSQVRPEWGLAGNAAFIAAPRSRTRGIDLGGRAFLHEYDWRSDNDFGVLEMVMTAPVVVGSWINLQYYGSTVDNRAFGAGNKVLHNVVGATLGVFEGNGGDLRTGLPLQSLHDGKRWVHEPLRMSVCIEAPCAAIDAVIEKHAAVRDLVANGWLYLFQIAPDGSLHRWRAARQWEPFDAQHVTPG